MTGDEVKKLDVLSNALVINMLQSSYSTCVLVSEENKEAIITSKEKRVRVAAGLRFFYSPVEGATELRRIGLPCFISVSGIFPLLLNFCFPETTVCIFLYFEVLCCLVKETP